jgi:general secretion pathway protein D
MQRRYFYVSLLGLSTLFLAGCPKGSPEFKAARQAESAQDYDSALVHYTRALREDPTNAEYRLRATRMRFTTGQWHIQQGQKACAAGDLQTALGEFQKARGIDPSSAIAEQELQKTLDLIAAAKAAEALKSPATTPPGTSDLASLPPELKPLSREPINLKMTNEARIVFETIAKLAGLTVIFDPDFNSRRISVELPNVTLEQALDAVSLESKAFWKPLTSNIIVVAPDQTQKRKDFEDQVVQTFYLSNTVTPQDLTEIVTGLRQLLDLRRITQVNQQNAIIIRDTPDKLTLAGKIIRDIDKAKPEVVIQVEVLQARLDRLRDLGIQPGSSAVLSFTPRSALGPGSTGSSTSGTTTGTTSSPQVTLNNLKHLSTSDYSLTLPGAVANALLTDNTTRIIQNPEIRVTDGQTAKVRIGDRIPIATGSFQAGVGVGVGGGAGVINPLVNTQFQYIDVGVNIDVTPRVHPDGDVSMKLSIEVSSVSGTRSIGGIDQPVISQNKIDHDIRLKEGEANILGGLIEREVIKNLSGWPGVSHIPFLRYFFSNEHTELADKEVLIILTPRVIRLPSITAENLRSLAAGTDTNVRVYKEDEMSLPAPVPLVPPASTGTSPAAPPQPSPASAQLPQPAGAARLRFEPATPALKAGDSTTIGLIVDGVNDLFSIPLLLKYNPAVIQIDEVRHGGFLSGGTQEIAIVQRVDQQRGEAIISATRQPNTPGVSGTGTLLGIVIHAVGPGISTLQILQVNPRDSQQRPIPMASQQATITVQ